jgi:hypothetical protein
LKFYDIQYVDINAPNPYIATKLKKTVVKYNILPGSRSKLYIKNNIIYKIDGRDLTNLTSNRHYYKVNGDGKNIKNGDNLIILSTYAPVTIYYAKEYTDSYYIASDFSKIQYVEMDPVHSRAQLVGDIWSNNGVWYPERIQK